MSALLQTFTKEHLISFWKKNHIQFSSKTSPGIDKIDKPQFAKNIELEIRSIVKDISKGSYVFSPLKPIPIPKEGDKVRLINVPTVRDRFVQRVIVDFLVRNYRKRWKIPQSFSSMGGDSEGVLSIIKNISDKVGQKDIVIRADLSQYFDTINRDLMKEIVKRYVRHRSFHSIIFAIIDCETQLDTFENRAMFSKSGISRGKGLRQGMPLSPLLSYLFLADIDRAMNNGFFRYVDDLLFIGPTKEDVKLKFFRYQAAAEKRGLKIHPISVEENAKSKIFFAEESFDFLGIRIDRKPEGNRFLIPPKSAQRIRDEIKAYSILDRNDKKKQKDWLRRTIAKTSGMTRNYSSAYSFCENWVKFEKELKELQIFVCRQIISQISALEKKGSKEIILRLFGIS